MESWGDGNNLADECKANKKRDREIAFGSAKPDEPNIDEILNQLKQRVLIGETLQSFGKDINLLIDLILLKDPKFERTVDIVAEKLSSILQKPEQEMKMMLKRTFFQNKKKAQKLEIDKLQVAFVKTIELCLKETNKTDNL